MKSIIKIFVAVIAVATLLTACGKYPDGPKISLKTKMARITRVWTDASSTSTNSTIEFKKDGTVYANGSLVSGYTWKFSSDKANIEWSYGGLSSSDKIMRLTSKDLWLQSAGSSTIDKYTAK